MNRLTCKQVKELKIGEKVIFAFLPDHYAESTITSIDENGSSGLTVCFENGFEFYLRPWLEDESLAIDSSSSKGPIYLVKL